MGTAGEGLKGAPSISIHATLGLIILLQAILLARDAANGAVVDPWLALFPVLWMDLALVALVALAWGLSFGGPASSTIGRWRKGLSPDYGTLRSALRHPPLLTLVIAISVAYATILLFFERALVIDPSGELLPHGTTYPYIDSSTGPLGWGPRIVLAPDPFLVLDLRPYTLSSALLLGTLVGLTLGLTIHRRWAGRARLRRGAAGAATGFFLLCPVCAASPTAALLGGLLTPALVGTPPGAAGLPVHLLTAFSTAMLGASILLLWTALVRTSKGPSPGGEPRGIMYPHNRGGQAIFVAAMALALLSLLLDLARVPVGSGGLLDHGGLGAHDPWVILLALLACIGGVLGIATYVPGFSRSPRSVAVVATLTLLFIDGVLHWLAVSEHAQDALSVAFFLLAGAVELLAIPLALRWEAVLRWMGLLVVPLLLVLYVASRTVGLPFGGVEPLEDLGLISKGVELAFMAEWALVFLRGRLPVTRGGAAEDKAH